MNHAGISGYYRLPVLAFEKFNDNYSGWQWFTPSEHRRNRQSVAARWAVSCSATARGSRRWSNNDSARGKTNRMMGGSQQFQVEMPPALRRETWSESVAPPARSIVFTVFPSSAASSLLVGSRETVSNCLEPRLFETVPHEPAAHFQGGQCRAGPHHHEGITHQAARVAEPPQDKFHPQGVPLTHMDFR